MKKLFISGSIDLLENFHSNNRKRAAIIKKSNGNFSIKYVWSNGSVAQKTLPLYKPVELRYFIERLDQG